MSIWLRQMACFNLFMRTKGESDCVDRKFVVYSHFTNELSLYKIPMNTKYGDRHVHICFHLPQFKNTKHAYTKT